MYWSKFPYETHFLLFMDGYHVTVIQIKNRGNDFSHWELHDILPIFFLFFL